MERQVTEQEFRRLYHKMIEWTLPPEEKKNSAWEKISRFLWGETEKG